MKPHAFIALAGLVLSGPAAGRQEAEPSATRTAEVSAAPESAAGIEQTASQRSVPETVKALRAAIERRGLRLFAVIDHSENARGAELELDDTVLVLFGNPKVGTPLMRSARTVGLDLPQKFLVWREAPDRVWITYNRPAYLAERHGLSGNDAALGKIADLLRALAQEAAGS